MAGLNIPGVTDQYKTNESIEKLMQVERIPLNREKTQLDGLKAQKDAWRDVNSQLASLREKTKALYSFENPFNSKITDSSQESAISAEATRSAELQSFKIDVLQPATADRFMSDEMEKDFKVPSGTYTYKVGEKQLSFNWKGGTLKDFSNAINRRSNNLVKSMIIGGSSGKSALMIESMVTGAENRLEYEQRQQNQKDHEIPLHELSFAAHLDRLFHYAPSCSAALMPDARPSTISSFSLPSEL